jgi:hypothetical protein
MCVADGGTIRHEEHKTLNGTKNLSITTTLRFQLINTACLKKYEYFENIFAGKILNFKLKYNL